MTSAPSLHARSADGQSVPRNQADYRDHNRRSDVSAAAFYRIDAASDRALLRVTILSIWTRDGTIALFRELKPLIARDRARFGRCRVLVDRREIPDPAPDVAEIIKSANRDLYRPDDRVALIVGSSLLKAEVRHSVPGQGTKAFLSIDAAEMWLKGS